MSVLTFSFEESQPSQPINSVSQLLAGARRGSPNWIAGERPRSNNSLQWRRLNRQFSEHATWLSTLNGWRMVALTPNQSSLNREHQFYSYLAGADGVDSEVSLPLEIGHQFYSDRAQEWKKKKTVHRRLIRRSLFQEVEWNLGRFGTPRIRNFRVDRTA